MAALYPYIKSGQSSRSVNQSEFEILRASHKFLRDDDGNEKELSWDEQLAAKYYDSLYREFAICDLKHYKSGNFALRWRTENEVLSGAGETSCANTRCEYHSAAEGSGPPLTTLELPFTYEEHGDVKSALVKVVLCPRCCKKLMWKRRKEKERETQRANESKERVDEEKEERVGISQRKHLERPERAADEKLDEGGAQDRKRRRREVEDIRAGADGTERVERKRSRRESRSRSPHRSEHHKPKR